MKPSLRSLSLCLTAAAGLMILPMSAAFADSNDWHWGRGMMGRWFMGEMNHGMMDGWGPGMMMGERYNAERLDDLKRELGITDAQQKLWDSYAEAVKSSVSTMRSFHESMMDGKVPDKLPERLALHESMMTTRIESMKTVNAAVLALYDKLTDAQKAKADDLIAGMGMM
jgi:LTXXQ motif family protein